MDKTLSLIAEEKITPAERAKIMDEKDFLRLKQRERKEAADEECKRMAVELLARGMDPATIAQICKMSDEAVRALAAKPADSGLS